MEFNELDLQRRRTIRLESAQNQALEGIKKGREFIETDEFEELSTKAQKYVMDMMDGWMNQLNFIEDYRDSVLQGKSDDQGHTEYICCESFFNEIRHRLDYTKIGEGILKDDYGNIYRLEE